jgi:6-pyruvoyltetrahydropterin/6-carboxytetrahydropterin synthase
MRWSSRDDDARNGSSEVEVGGTHVSTDHAGEHPRTVASPASVGAMTSSATVLVSRRESFNAAHQLRDPSLSDEENQQIFGKCANLHGHNYVLEVVVAGQVDGATGYVLDVKLLSDVIRRRVIDDVDHRNLNTDVPWLEGCIPTAENLAVAFWERIRSELPEGMLRSLRLWETDKNWAQVGDPI